MSRFVITQFVVVTAALSAIAFGQSRSNKEVPNLVGSSLIRSSLSLDARNLSTGWTEGESSRGKGVTRTTTAHTETVEITVRNLGVISVTATIHWFWVGRYTTSKNWFRAGDAEKLITLEPNKTQTILAENEGIEAFDTRKKSKKRPEHYQSGGNLQGWVVVAYDGKHEILATKTSDPLLAGFVVSPPPKKRE